MARGSSGFDTISSSAWPLVSRRSIVRSLVVSGLALGSSAAPAFAQNAAGENPFTITLSEADCPFDFDVAYPCYDAGDDANFRCDLFAVTGATTETGDTLATTLCADRSVLTNLEPFPDEGPIETGVAIRGTTHGYIRALSLEDEFDPVHVVTATLGAVVNTVRVSVADDDGDVGPQCSDPRIQLPDDLIERADFCAAIAAALPVTDGDNVLRFVLTVDYEDANLDSNFGTSDLMELWACPGFDAQCVADSPAQFDDELVAGAAVLDELILRNGLTNSYSRFGPR